MNQRFQVGDLVKMIFTNRIGIVLVASDRSIEAGVYVWLYLVRWSDTGEHWELEEALELVSSLSNT